MKHVLIVEDEKKLADILIAYLNKEQFRVTHYESGNGVSDWIKNNQPNIILLDLMLPDVNGKDLCKEMVEEDYKAARRMSLLKENNLQLPFSIED